MRKRYGRTVALDGLDMSVPAGVICGFVGSNGAGKTTAFGIVGGLIRADAGEIDVLGRVHWRRRNTPARSRCCRRTASSARTSR